MLGVQLILSVEDSSVTVFGAVPAARVNGIGRFPPEAVSVPILGALSQAEAGAGLGPGLGLGLGLGLGAGVPLYLVELVVK